MQSLDIALFGVTALYFGVWRTWKGLFKWYHWIKLGKLPPKPQQVTMGIDLNSSSSKLLSNKSLTTETPLKEEAGPPPSHQAMNNNLMTQTLQ